MEIPKGYELSEFVDSIMAYAHESENYERSCIKIGNYNDFIKQPPTKGMFVNETPHPDNMPVIWSEKGSGTPYDSQLKQWEQAESKVIFKDWIQQGDDYFVLSEKAKIVVFIQFVDDNEIYLNVTELEGLTRGFEINTLSDLFTAVKDLELKNVNI